MRPWLQLKLCPESPERGHTAQEPEPAREAGPGPGAPEGPRAPGPGLGGIEQERIEPELIETGRCAILISTTRGEIQSSNGIRTKTVPQRFIEVLHVP
jgi:hypothetical protein